MENNKKAIEQVEKVASVTQDMSKTISKMEAYVLAINVLMVVKKVSKGLMTESEALSFLKGNATLVVICEGVSIVSSLLISLLKQIEKSEEESKKDDECYDDDIADLDDEKEYESFIKRDDEEPNEEDGANNKYDTLEDLKSEVERRKAEAKPYDDQYRALINKAHETIDKFGTEGELPEPEPSV